MADPSAPGDPGALDPDHVARREFTTTFRGFDQAEVKAFLTSVSVGLRDLIERERDVRARLDDTERRVTDAEELDEHQLTALLGSETARILDAAREAAAEIRSKAEAKTAQLVREAQDGANATLSDAAEVMRLRTTEAEAAAASIVADAEAERDRLLAEAAAQVEAGRVEAAADAERVRAEAQQVLDDALVQAEDTVEAARTQGREMVAEAQVVRERILTDLARRRRSGKAQLEQLRAARERLLEAYALVRRTVEEATTELTVAVPEAKLAAESAGRRVEMNDDELTVEAIEAELDAGRVAGMPLLDTGEVPVTRVADDRGEVGRGDDESMDPTVSGEVGPAGSVDSPGSADEVDHESDAVIDLVGRDEPPEGAAPGDPGGRPVFELVRDPAPVGAPSSGAGPSTSASASSRPSRPSVELVPDPDPGHVGDEPGQAGEPAPPAASVGDDPVADDPEDVDATDDEASAESASAQEPGRVDDLFARLRSEVPVDEDDTDAAAEPDSHTETSSDAGDVPDADDVAVSDLVERGESALERRDRLTVPLERDLARVLKRQLADDENDKLDAIRRRSPKAGPDELLSPVAEDQARLVEAVADLLLLSAAAGAEFAQSTLDPDLDPDDAVIDVDIDLADLAADLAQGLLAPLRDRVTALVVDSQGDDALDGVRACYRQWKGQANDVAAQYVHTAFNRGVFGSTPDGEQVSWVVDPDGGPCADGEDNSLEGPVVKGTPFPTGHVHPPAHPACRCLLVPGAM